MLTPKISKPKVYIIAQILWLSELFLHVIAAGSLLEFALEELPTFGVGRIHSIFMYPMTFDEFLTAGGQQLLLRARNAANPDHPLPDPIYNKLVEQFRVYMLVGGMPEVVDCWVKTHDFLQCQRLQDDLIVSYEDDFSKYRKKVDPQLLRLTLRSAAVQTAEKFTYAREKTLPGRQMLSGEFRAVRICRCACR